jgi:hypothetical protein
MKVWYAQAKKCMDSLSKCCPKTAFTSTIASELFASAKGTIPRSIAPLGTASPRRSAALRSANPSPRLEGLVDLLEYWRYSSAGDDATQAGLLSVRII